MPCLVVGGKNITKAARVGVNREAIIEEDKTLMCGEFCYFVLSLKLNWNNLGLKFCQV